jgi:predicted ABC-type ATPase
VWVCGCVASGKTAIGEAAILPLGFALIDTDAVFEDLLRKYGLSSEIPAPTAEEKELARRAAAARRMALKQDLWPKMTDWPDPLDYLADKQPLTHGHLQAVAREITRRALAEGRKERNNLLVVETGGHTGKILNTRQALQREGYETFLVWVGLRSLDDALRRNRARGLAGGRCLHSEITQRSFTVAQEARDKLVETFEPSMLMIDNSEDGEERLGGRISDVKAAICEWMNK